MLVMEHIGTNKVKFFARIVMYLILLLCFKEALLMLSNSLKMIDIHRNMSELWQIVCKKYNFNISALTKSINIRNHNQLTSK